jgi:hypothetical protein
MAKKQEEPRERGAEIILRCIVGMTEALYKHNHKWTAEEKRLHERALTCLGISPPGPAIMAIEDKTRERA